MLDYEKRLIAILRGLKEAELGASVELTGWKYRSCGYEMKKMIEEDPADWGLFPEGGLWGSDGHACFYTEFALSEEYEKQHTIFHVETGEDWNVRNPQFLVCLDGEQICGIDGNHREFELPRQSDAGKIHTLRLYAYANDGIDGVPFHVYAAILEDEVRSLWFDLWTALEAAVMLSEDSLERITLLQTLNHAVNLLDMRKPGSPEFYQSVSACAAYVKQEIYETGNPGKEVKVHCIGHTHIDVAWRWPLRQTREKAVRSFSTVIKLMEQYPGYRFMSSQP